MKHTEHYGTIAYVYYVPFKRNVFHFPSIKFVALYWQNKLS